MLYKWKSSTVLYLLSLFKNSELKLELELKLKLKFESELLLLLVSELTGTGVYWTSVDHKKDTWITTDWEKHDMK